MQTTITTRNAAKRANTHRTSVIEEKNTKSLADFILPKNKKSLKDIKGKISFSDEYDYKSLRK